MPISSIELRNKVITGSIVTTVDIDSLLNQQITEDQYLDYKHGLLLSQHTRPCEVVREYLTGFANADGRVLLIGIDETTWSVTGTSAPGGQVLGRWAKSCVIDLAGHFSPLPRFQTVNHPDGNILVAAAARSANLVPDVRGREILYHLRIHDSTVVVPEYLLTDLVLGRRQHPVLRLVDYNFVNVELTRSEPDYILRARLVFQIENDSLEWAEDLRIGLVAYNHVDSNTPQISQQLKVNLNIKPVDASHFPYQNGLIYRELSQSGVVRGPFEISYFQMPHSERISSPLSHLGQFCLPYTWQAAAYLISKNSPPFWYQIDFRIDSSLLELIRSGGKDALNQQKHDYFELAPIQTDLAVVGWTPLID